MTPLVPLMMFGWLPLSVFWFLRGRPHRAVLFCVIGGWLFLPMIEFTIPGLPDYTKNVAIALGLLIGGYISGNRQSADFCWTVYDLPLIFWCLSPVFTSLSNGLGVYDGLSGLLEHFVVWACPYLAGRIYFNSENKIRELCIGMLIGGVLYLFLCLYEIRMSPQLSNIFYGFFPHSFLQHIRYGGFRPIVFLQHGLMVSLWMAITTIVAFWLWRSGEIKKIFGIPIFVIVFLMISTTILCKSANGWLTLVIGISFYYVWRYLKTPFPLLVFLIAIPVYVFLRASNIVSVQEVVAPFSGVFDPERVGSLELRLFQEDLFCVKALQRPVFGWAGYGRGWPVDPGTGEKMIRMIDSLWLIVFSSKGFFGIYSMLAMMLVGPWKVLRLGGVKLAKSETNGVVPVVLSFVVILFLIDSLVNGMVNPIYITTSGALVSFYITLQKKSF